MRRGVDAQGGEVSLCKKGCGMEVYWRRPIGGGTPQCFNSGTDIVHWDSCSQARTKRVMAEGAPFADEKGEGFIFEGKKKYFHMVAETRFGKIVHKG